MTQYFKITNETENHNGFQYQDGLNVLIEEFNNDPTASCCAGGFYFTTKEHIHKFYYFGVNLRVIELPTEDPDFQMVSDPQNDKFRANKIILKEKYSLASLETYLKFGIEPNLLYCAGSGYLDIIKYFVEK